MCTTQHPQLVRGHLAHSSYRMIVPTTAKSIKVILQAWEEHKVAAEEVCSVVDAEEALFFKVVENIVVDACYPEAAQSWKIIKLTKNILM